MMAGVADDDQADIVTLAEIITAQPAMQTAEQLLHLSENIAPVLTSILTES